MPDDEFRTSCTFGARCACLKVLRHEVCGLCPHPAVVNQSEGMAWIMPCTTTEVAERSPCTGDDEKDGVILRITSCKQRNRKLCLACGTLYCCDRMKAINLNLCEWIDSVACIHTGLAGMHCLTIVGTRHASLSGWR